MSTKRRMIQPSVINLMRLLLEYLRKQSKKIKDYWCISLLTMYSVLIHIILPVKKIRKELRQAFTGKVNSKGKGIFLE